MNDFRYIQYFESWVQEKHDESVDYLYKHITDKDVVVTHHVPSQLGSSSKYWNSPLQPFFIADVDKIIVEKNPKMWIFGHTHDSCNTVYPECQTKLICNPYGYYDLEVNESFNRKLTINV
jgi:Icc-related predicted phosphoesterase